MIYDVLNFLKRQLEASLNESRASAEPLIALSNPWSSNDNNKNSSFLNAISLINVEEEKIFKTQGEQYSPGRNGTYYKKEPDIKLNLYVLISAYNKNYEDGLKFISRVVGYFQQNSVFQQNPSSSATQQGLPLNIEKIIIELYTAGFEQQNQIWASLSTGYLPSVIYKVRMLIIDAEGAATKEYQSIRQIRTQF